ncbi:hypothetical protein ABLE68_06265 [Nocardioides sp. CN2-186]|uniref:hypothetical protein n=1 Tax=Nocardioides tweenelious TaxID=3156607 RepID=UPI0032B5C309
MGHYHRIINLTQRMAIEPTDVGVLDKLCEFGQSSGTAMAAVWLLLGREAWCGDRIAILGYEGRPNDLPPEVVSATGIDGTAFYDYFDTAAEVARSVLVERGVSTFTTRMSGNVELWDAHPVDPVAPAGVEVVAANLDREQVLDPAQFGDSRDLHLAAANGGLGGVTTALAAVLAASNRGGSRGGGDLRSWHPLVGSWAGDRVGVVPIGLASDFTDVSADVRQVLADAEEGAYEVTTRGVMRLDPPWFARAFTVTEAD